MAKYRKKPVVIDAVQFTREMAEGSESLPDGVQFRRRGLNSKGRFHDFAADTNFRYCHRHSVTTREGEMDVQVGDFVIRDGKGEFVLCKPDVFVAIYESADEPAAPVVPVVTEADENGDVWMSVSVGPVTVDEAIACLRRHGWTIDTAALTAASEPVSVAYRLPDTVQAIVDAAAAYEKKHGHYQDYRLSLRDDAFPVDKTERAIVVAYRKHAASEVRG